jgi:hypothetical protein
MWIFSVVVHSFVKHSTRIACSILLLFWCTSLTGQETRSGSPVSDAVELEALKVLNESDWVHTVTPTIQDGACTEQNPAFPGLYPQDWSVGAEPRTSGEVIKPDSSEYLIRFQSAKPVQTAIQKLVAMGEKWSAYKTEITMWGNTHGPTDPANGWYNLSDMITIAVILKHPGPDGTSLFDYGYNNARHTFPAAGFRIFPCAGLRTGNGQVFVHVVIPFANDGQPRSLQLSFPRLIDGKLLISSERERVDFRLVVNQRVFETSFFVNASDVLDGSEKPLYLPSAFTASNQVVQQ